MKGAGRPSTSLKKSIISHGIGAAAEPCGLIAATSIIVLRQYYGTKSAFANPYMRRSIVIGITYCYQCIKLSIGHPDPCLVITSFATENSVADGMLDMLSNLSSNIDHPLHLEQAFVYNHLSIKMEGGPSRNAIELQVLNCCDEAMRSKYEFGVACDGGF